jgi:hypothetical protein
MVEIDDIFPKREGVLYNTSKDFQDEVDRQDQIQRDKISIKLQLDLTKQLQDLEATFQKQREIDRQERDAERKLYLEREAKAEIVRKKERVRDRRLLWKASIIAAVIGAIVASVLTIILERRFK